MAALSRLLQRAPAAEASTTDLMVPASLADLTVTDVRALGGAFVLEGLWRRLGIDAAIRTALVSRHLDTDVDAAQVERIAFGLTASRALRPKPGAGEGVRRDEHLDALAAVDGEACHLAMESLLNISSTLSRDIHRRVAEMLGLDVDVLFVGAMASRFSMRDGAELAAGPSEDQDDDWTRAMIGVAITREGIPVRVWTWPRGRGRVPTRGVDDDLRGWPSARVVWVADRSFSSSATHRHLQRGGGHYIIGEKLRPGPEPGPGSDEAMAALSRRGRYRVISDRLRIKEVKIDNVGDRWLICRYPDAAERDRHARDALVARLAGLIDRSESLSRTGLAELRGAIRTRPGLSHFVRTTPAGLLRLDCTAIRTAGRLDGGYLLRCSDPTLSAEEIAVGYKQLLDVERGWHELTGMGDLRPVRRDLHDRIRVHVLLCWLALLLVRVAELATGRTWSAIRAELDRIHMVTLTSPVGTFRQTTALTRDQRELLRALGLEPPDQIPTG